MIAIIKKELRSYFRNISTYLLIAGYMVIVGLYFTRSILSGNKSLSDSFNDISVVLPLFIPLITMRSFAAERGEMTDRILLTGRTNISAIVSAKYTAACITYLFAVSIAFLFPVAILALYGSNIGTILLMYLGFSLFGMGIIAFGIFLSSLSSHPYRAGIVTIACIMLFWMMNNILTNIDNTVLHSLIMSISIFTHLNSFRDSLLGIAPIIYMISFSFVFILLTIQTLNLWRARRFE